MISLSLYRDLLESKGVVTDRSGNVIGGIHVDYRVEDYSAYGVQTQVQKSSNTESVYVYYYLGDKKAVVRFSNHDCNAIKSGDMIDGTNHYDTDLIKFKLGLLRREFIPRKHKSIACRKVSKRDMSKYEECDMSIQDMYKLPIGSDLSMYTGMLAKGSNYLIFGKEVEEEIETRRNWMGQEVQIGHFVYYDNIEKK